MVKSSQCAATARQPPANPAVGRPPPAANRALHLISSSQPSPHQTTPQHSPDMARPILRLPRAGLSHAPRRALHINRVHLPSQWPTFTPYAVASTLQESLAAPHHAFKAGATSTPPSPSLLSFTPAPTYTLGRRQRSLDEGIESILTAPLTVSRSGGVKPGEAAREPGSEGIEAQEGREETVFKPEVTHSTRGGLTTYHGPGQLVLWPVLDLRSPLYPPQTVRSYARLLENTTMAVIKSLYGIRCVLDEENPGVWVPTPGKDAQEAKKIAAMGIHLRRHVATLGVAINLDVPVEGGQDVNPWARFVPCGIEGRGVTSVEAEGKEASDAGLVAWVWAEEFAKQLEKE